MSTLTLLNNKLPHAPKPEEIDPATGLIAGSFGVGTYRVAGRIFPGLVKSNGTLHDLSNLYPDTHALFDDWDRAFDSLFDLAASAQPAGLSFEEAEKLPPLAHPNLLCAGSNYRVHVAEMMTFNKFNPDARGPGESDEAFFRRNLAEVDRRASEGMPFFWTGLHSSLAGADDPVQLPLIGENPDWELEFGVVVARSGRYVPPEAADSLIAGYVMVNDIGTVDEFRRADVRFQYDWISKHQPGFKISGPFIVPKVFVDRSKVQIQLKLNGEFMQDWPISDMIFSPEQILAYASERVRLMPGDFLITGSPPGNGAMHGGRWLRPGDFIESEITFLGRQRNRIVKEDTKGQRYTYGPFIKSY